MRDFPLVWSCEVLSRPTAGRASGPERGGTGVARAAVGGAGGAQAESVHWVPGEGVPFPYHNLAGKPALGSCGPALRCPVFTRPGQRLAVPSMEASWPEPAHTGRTALHYPRRPESSQHREPQTVGGSELPAGRHPAHSRAPPRSSAPVGSWPGQSLGRAQ